MNQRAEKYIKRQIRSIIANKNGIDNLNLVSQELIDHAFKNKELYQYRIRMDKMEDGRIYFAFVDKETGYYCGSAII